jgi:hypothetical protein
MRLSEMLTKIGDDKIKLQSLQPTQITNSERRRESKITFVTDLAIGQDLTKAIMSNGKPEKLGIIVWLPREDYERIIEQNECEKNKG